MWLEYLFYVVVCVPLFFLPMILFDIFTLPQTVLLALLSAVGVVGLGASGSVFVSLPVLLALLLAVYMVISTFWTQVLDGARKEFAIQFSLLLLFVLVLQIRQASMVPILVVMYCASLLSQLYALGQTFEIDFIFPFRLTVRPYEKNDLPDRRPIATIGNMNFFASYILPLFWVGFYLAVTVSPLFSFGLGLNLFLLWKTKCRGAWIGFAGSWYCFLLLLSVSGVFPSMRSFLVPIVLLGVLAVGSVMRWLWKRWDRINNEKIKTLKTTQLASLRYRICYWRSGWYLFKQKIWQGWGLRSYRKLVYFAQADINDKDLSFLDPERYITPQPRECHNDWLEDLVELGITGTLIRWGLMGLIFCFGIKEIFVGSLFSLFLLAAILSIAIHAVFFFGMRLPSTGMVFWVLGGLLIVSSDASAQILRLPPVVSVGAAIIFAVYLWEMVGKEVIGSYYFMKFQSSKSTRQKERLCLKAVQWSPKETIYNTNMMVGYLNVSPPTANKFAEPMWFDYDGMTPGWVMHYNMGAVAESMNNIELAFRHYGTSHRLLPTFQPSIEKVVQLAPYMPLPKKGEFMKKVKEEARLNILLMRSQMDNLELQKQNVDAAAHNLILQEAARMNIPQGWHYDFQTGEFCSPEELTERQKQQVEVSSQKEAQPSVGSTNPPKEGE